MKYYTVTLAMVLSGFAVNAQTSDEEAEAIINLLGVQKREAMQRLVMVSKKDSAAFWKLYDEYQSINKTQARDRLRLYERTAASYADLTAEIADSLANRYFENRVQQEEKLQQYYKKIKAATNAVTAFEFYQAEIYMLTQLRASIMQQIPAYGQLAHARKR